MWNDWVSLSTFVLTKPWEVMQGTGMRRHTRCVEIRWNPDPRWRHRRLSYLFHVASASLPYDCRDDPLGHSGQKGPLRLAHYLRCCGFVIVESQANTEVVLAQRRWLLDQTVVADSRAGENFTQHLLNIKDWLTSSILEGGWCSKLWSEVIPFSARTCQQVFDVVVTIHRWRTFNLYFPECEIRWYERFIQPLLTTFRRSALSGVIQLAYLPIPLHSSSGAY